MHVIYQALKLWILVFKFLNKILFSEFLNNNELKSPHFCICNNVFKINSDKTPNIRISISKAHIVIIDIKIRIAVLLFLPFKNIMFKA